MLYIIGTEYVAYIFLKLVNLLYIVPSGTANVALPIVIMQITFVIESNCTQSIKANSQLTKYLIE